MVVVRRGRSEVSAGLLASASLLLLGQILQIALGPYSRAQGTFVTRSGIALLSPDSPYYLNNSVSLEVILETSWTNWSYLLVGRIAHLSGDVAASIVVFQMLIVLLVGAMLHAGVGRVVGPLGAWIAVAAFSLNPFVAQWFRFVHTETLFFSLIIALVLLSSGLILGSAGSTRVVIALQLALGVLATGMRPNGILVLLSVLLLIAWRSLPRRGAVIVSLCLATTAPLLLVAVLSSAGQPAEASVTSQLYDGVVVEGTEEVRIRIKMPPPANRADDSLGAAVRFGLSEPLAVARLFGTRIAVEVLQLRPHYARIVNVGAAGAVILYLTLAALGASRGEAAPLLGPVLTVMLPLLLVVGLTFASPEARYGWSGLIALAPLVGIGSVRVLDGRRPR